MSGAVEPHASAARFEAAKEAKVKVDDRANVPGVQVDQGEAVRETVNRMAERGFEPTVLIFHNRENEVEVFTRGVELEPFLRWMVDVWVPARDIKAGS